MLKRVLFSSFLALVICGISFYLAYFVGLIYSAATGPLNPANTQSFQAALRHIALPICIGLGIATFIIAFRGLCRRISDKKPAKVVPIR
jgi:hypothetical protein